MAHARSPDSQRRRPRPAADAPVQLDRRDHILLNHAQGGLPVVSRPFAALGEALAMSEEEVLFRLRHLAKAGVLSRFGPILNARQMGGERTLAALHVPPERFQEVAAIVNRLPTISHNYERDHHYNMWFVVSSDDEAEVERTLQAIERQTGLRPLNLPALEEYFVEVNFQFDPQG